MVPAPRPDSTTPTGGQRQDYVDAIVDYADRRMADEIGAMPDGDYESEGWIDSDGVESSCAGHW